MRWLVPLLVVGMLDAGTYKTTFPFSRLPVDLTVALAGLTLIVVAARLLRSAPRHAGMVVAGFLLLVPPTLWTVAGEYGDQKVSRLFTLTLLAALAPAILIRSVADARRFLWAWTGLSMFAVLAVILFPQASATYEGAPVTALGSNTISTGRTAGLVVVVAALALMWRQIPWPFAVALGAAGVYAVLQSGSRGPLFSALLAVVLASVGARARPPLRRAMVTAGLVGLALVTFFGLAPLYARERIAIAAEGQVTGSSATERLELYRAAVDSIISRPLGLGWGGFARIAVGDNNYPHDLVLEVLSEAGILFGTAFLLWLAWNFIWLRGIDRGFTGNAVFGLACYALLNALVSGDLNDNRSLFFLLGIGIALHATTPEGEPPSTAPAGEPSPAVPLAGEAAVAVTHTRS